MKHLEIEETDSQLVIKVAGSKIAHLARKGDADEIRQTLLDVLAEAPAEKPVEPEPEELPPAAEEDDLGATMGSLLEGIGQLLKSPEAQRARSVLERLPKPKKRGTGSGG
jgi:hypothetical protein